MSFELVIGTIGRQLPPTDCGERVFDSMALGYGRTLRLDFARWPAFPELTDRP